MRYTRFGDLFLSAIALAATVLLWLRSRVPTLAAGMASITSPKIRAAAES